jgi:hypothetical protein
MPTRLENLQARAAVAAPPLTEGNTTSLKLKATVSAPGRYQAEFAFGLDRYEKFLGIVENFRPEAVSGIAISAEAGGRSRGRVASLSLPTPAGARSALGHDPLDDVEALLDELEAT